VPSPKDASLFVQKVVQGSFELLLAFVESQVSSMRAQGWSAESESRESRQVRREWSNFHSSVYLSALQNNCDALAIPVQAPDTSRYGDWRAVDADFQWVFQGFQKCRTDYDRITSQLATFISMRENERSRRIAAITGWVAAIATPAALISSFLSMSTDYLPGGESMIYFWIALISCFAGIAVGWSLYYCCTNRRQLSNLFFLLGKRRREIDQELGLGGSETDESSPINHIEDSDSEDDQNNTMTTNLEADDPARSVVS
jgi:hypothetical protein